MASASSKGLMFFKEHCLDGFAVMQVSEILKSPLLLGLALKSILPFLLVLKRSNSSISLWKFLKEIF